jgi:superfamily II DNA or RNA helicase
MPEQITLANRLYVPAHKVSTQQLERWHYSWTEAVYEYRLDEVGEVVRDDKGDPIKDKRIEDRTLIAYRELFSANGDAYIAFPRGDLEKLKPFLQDGYVDTRPIAPLGFQLRMSPDTMQDHRWPDQRACAEKFLRKGGGIITADTGAGKTVMGAAVLVKLGLRTLVVSTMTDGVNQWLRELRKHTNLAELEQQQGRELAGPYRAGLKEPYPITVSTVQAFLHEGGRAFLHRYRDYFGLLMVDEVHTVASPEYSKVIGYLNPLVILGLTATVARKDQRHRTLFDLVGPVAAEGSAHQMPPKAYFISTGVEAPAWVYKTNYPSHYQWNIVLKTLADSEERFAVIKKFLYQDLDDGRKPACIAERRIFAQRLYAELTQDGYRAVYVDGEVPAKARDRIYREFRDGLYDVICAGKVLNALVDLPNLDCIHLLTPSNSKQTTKQIWGRSRRYVEGKRNPVLRYYVDTGGQLDGAYRNQLQLCREHNWEVELIGMDAAYMTGVGKYATRKKVQTTLSFDGDR